MILAEKTSQRKDQECHIFQELDQLTMPINKSELPQQQLMELDLKSHSDSLSIRYQWEH